MHYAALYPDQTAPSNQAESAAAPDNSLKSLLPNQLNIITSAWLSHLVQWQFSGNEMRILSAVFRHTIGFWKYEDDMNGARLQQITKIRYDHVNVIVKKLAARNILILRQGFHGFWMSINFNFSTWGKPNIDIHPSSNDPKQLLPKETEPADAGYSLDNLSETVPPTQDFSAAPSVSPQQIPAHVQAQVQAPLPAKFASIQNHAQAKIQIPSEIQTPLPVVNLDIVQTHQSLDIEANIQNKLSEFGDNMLSEVTQHMGDLAQTLGTTLNDKIKQLDKFEARMNMLEAFVEQQFNLNQHNQIGQTELDQFVQQQTQLIERHQQENRDTKTALEALFNQQRQADKTELKQLFQQQIKAHKVEIENTVKQELINTESINIPPTEIDMSLYEQYNKDYEHYQAEYIQFDDPIESSQQSTTIHKTESSNHQAVEKKEVDHSLYHTYLQELKQAYDHAKDQYSDYESHFSQVAEKESISFEQAIANENKQNFWKGILEALDLAHKNIEEYVNESPV